MLYKPYFQDWPCDSRYTYRLLLAENFAFLVGLLFVPLHHVLQGLFVGQVLLYLIVQDLWETKGEVSSLSSQAEQED